MTNQKYEITDIAHPEYPFLHRIRALRDIGSEVKAGDLGGFVEHEGNLSYEDADSWIYNDAIAAKGAVLSDRARAEDHAHVAGGRMENYARLSGHGLVSAISPSKFPVLSGECTVYGIVAGNVLVTSQAVVLGDEKIAHDGLDQLVVTERGRSIQRSPNRDKLLPSAEYFGYEPPKRKPRRKQKEAER